MAHVHRPPAAPHFLPPPHLDEPSSVPSLKKTDAWTYKRLDQLLEQDPSVQDGLDPAKVRLWRRQYVKVIATAGVNLKM